MVFSKKAENDWKPSPHDVRVKPWAHWKVKEKTEALREQLGLNNPCVDVQALLDILSTISLIEYEIVDDDDDELQTVYALTRGRNIKFKSSVIDATDDIADPGYNRARFTVVHEVGHALKHHRISVALAGGLARALPPRAPYESAECEANAFAAHFLMPASAIKKCSYNPVQVSRLCHVSTEAASYQCGLVRRKDW